MNAIIFCQHPFDKTTVDPEYLSEFEVAKSLGFEVLLFSFEDLINPEYSYLSTRAIKASNSIVPIPVIYRGWMLTPEQYQVLYDLLLLKSYQLINNPTHYRTCHYLPESLPYIASLTPSTIFQSWDSEQSLELLLEKAKDFQNKPVILKDYVKSEKHHWLEACFIPNSSDQSRLKNSILRLIELRGSELNQGIVIREFVELKDLTIHSKSGMPLKEEYRLFFYKQQLVGIYPYWEEGEYLDALPSTSVFEAIARTIPSQFFSMDIACTQQGQWLIIELGDGQVSGLPDKVDCLAFYQALQALV